MSGPQQWRKRPVVIEAMKVPSPDDLEAWGELAGWLMLHGCEAELTGPDDGVGVDGLLIATLEGTMRADLNDWIIRGVAGEFYPVKDGIFTETYEPVEADDEAHDGVPAEADPR